MKYLQQAARAGTMILLPAAGFVVMFISGCSGPTRVGTPVTQPLKASNMHLQRGQQAFMSTCHQCHPGGGAGLGPPLTGGLLNDSLIRFQVRNGLGSMPSFNERQISDQTLSDIVSYVQALRNLER